MYEPDNTEVDVVLTPTNLIGADSVTLTATGNLSAANAGTYESVHLTDIAIGGADAKYYEVGATADSVPLTAPVTISKAKAELKTPPTGKEGLTYTGEPQRNLKNIYRPRTKYVNIRNCWTMAS